MFGKRCERDRAGMPRLRVDEHRANLDSPSKPATTQTHRAGRGLSHILWFEPSGAIRNSTATLFGGSAGSSEYSPLRESPRLDRECMHTGTTTSSSAQYTHAVPCMFDMAPPTRVQLYASVCVFFSVLRRRTSVSARSQAQRYASRGPQVSIQMSLPASAKCVVDARIATKWDSLSYTLTPRF